MSLGFGNDLYRYQTNPRIGRIRVSDRSQREQQLQELIRNPTGRQSPVGQFPFSEAGIDNPIEQVFDEFEQRASEQLPFIIGGVIGILFIVVAVLSLR